MENTAPRLVRPMRVYIYATDALNNHMCRQRPQASRKNVAWSITGRLATTKRNGPFSNSSNFRRQSQQHSINNPQAPAQPSLAQHRDERRQQRDQETRIHQAGCGDDLARWTSLDGQNSGGLAGSDGFIVGNRLEIRMHIGDKCGADGREQTSLQESMRRLAG
jgi:hypothetical protein